MSSLHLGKRSRQPDPKASSCEQLQTPEATPNPKRARTTPTVIDGDGNKENIAPLRVTPVNNTQVSPPMSGRAARALRRSTTESFVTPRRKTGPRRTASFSSSFSNLTIATPPPTPLNFLPFHARARALLRPTCNDIISMPGRETERDAITDFLETFLNEPDTKSFHSLYISGAPGCGKTALMNSILDSLATGATRIINVNCVALINIDALWDRLVDEFDGVLQKKRKSGTRKIKGREGVESMLSEMTTRCILVLDEMDHIASSPQSISSLLNLARSDKLCVVGIANTHTLTSSSSVHVRTLHFSPYTSTQLLQILQSRLATLTPSAQGGSESTPDASVKQFLPLPTLTLLTKKIATLTGDVRTLFDVLRGAIDLAVTAASESNTTQGDDESFFAKAGPVCSVTPAHVLTALKTSVLSKSSQSSPASSQSSSVPLPPASASNSATVSKVGGLGLQARLVLLAVLLAQKRIKAGLSIDLSSLRRSSSSHKIASESSSSAGVDGAHLHTFYSHILRRGGDASVSTPVSRNEFADLLGMLEGAGLVVLGSSSAQTSPNKKRARFSKTSSSNKMTPVGLTGEVRLASGMWADEVLRGLGVTPRSSDSDASSSSKNVREEELNALWLREEACLRKELKMMEARKDLGNQAADKMFVDAFSYD